MSNIRQLFSLIASLPVAFENESGDDVTVKGIDLMSMRGSVTAAELPMRIVEPIGKLSSRVNNGLVIGADCGYEVTWQLQDGFFMKPIGIGSNLNIASADLVRYMGAYVSMATIISDELKQQLPEITLESIEIDPPNVFAYPLLGQSEYLGVVAKLTFKEFI